MDAIEIVKVEQEGPDGVLVTFSDGTIAGYVVEELLDLRPVREKASGTKPYAPSFETDPIPEIDNT
jgi:hypothetical protein